MILKNWRRPYVITIQNSLAQLNSRILHYPLGTVLQQEEACIIYVCMYIPQIISNMYQITLYSTLLYFPYTLLSEWKSSLSNIIQAFILYMYSYCSYKLSNEHVRMFKCQHSNTDLCEYTQYIGVNNMRLCYIRSWQFVKYLCTDTGLYKMQTFSAQYYHDAVRKYI